ncbi:hypothetical protein ABID97_003938 [Variovorax sp. OAS795]
MTLMLKTIFLFNETELDNFSYCLAAAVQIGSRLAFEQLALSLDGEQ